MILTETAAALPLLSVTMKDAGLRTGTVRTDSQSMCTLLVSNRLHVNGEPGNHNCFVSKVDMHKVVAKVVCCKLHTVPVQLPGGRCAPLPHVPGTTCWLKVTWIWCGTFSCGVNATSKKLLPLGWISVNAVVCCPRTSTVSVPSPALLQSTEGEW